MGYLYLKDSAFIAVKRDAKFCIRYVKGVLFVHRSKRGWNSGRSHWGRFEEKSSFLVLCTGAITNCVSHYFKIIKRLESH